MIRRAICTVIFLVIFAAGFAGATAPAAQAATCSDSWGNDGHSAPWYVGSNQSLHGNTVVITCPSGATSWNVNYLVIKMACPLGCLQFNPIDTMRSGHGSTSFSISTNPIGCNPGWYYYTKVHNVITGGNIFKPGSQGAVIC